MDSESDEPMEQQPLIVILDDEELFLHAWRLRLGREAQVETYTDPDLFLDQIAADKEFLGRISLIVSDRFFASLDAVRNRLDEAIRAEGYAGRIILCTDSVPHRAEGPANGFDALIGKAPLDLKSLRKWMS